MPQHSLQLYGRNSNVNVGADNSSNQRPRRGKYNNFLDDSGGGVSPIPMHNQSPSFDQKPYNMGGQQRSAGSSFPAYPTSGFDYDKSSSSARIGNGGKAQPQRKSRPPNHTMGSMTTRDVSQRDYFKPKKFKEEDSFAAMQATQLRTGGTSNSRRHSRASRGSKGSRTSRSKRNGSRQGSRGSIPRKRDASPQKNGKEKMNNKRVSHKKNQ